MSRLLWIAIFSACCVVEFIAQWGKGEAGRRITAPREST